MIGSEGEPTVVLIHGWPVTTAHWRFLLPRLVDAGHRVVQVTLPGLGDGGTGATARWDKASVADGLVATIGDMGCGRVVVVGHDWGGTVGLLAAQALGRQVAALVIEEEVAPGSTTVLPDTGYPTWHGTLLRAPGLAEALLPGRTRDVHRLFLEQSAGPTGLATATLEEYLDAYPDTEGQRAATMGYYRSGVVDAAAVSDALKAVGHVPVLAVSGACAMAGAVAESLRTTFTSVVSVESSTAGHYPLEQDEASADEVVRFVGRHLVSM